MSSTFSKPPRSVIVFPGLARVATSITAVKFLGLACIGLATAALLLRTAATFVARRAARPRT